ncbi:MAG: TolC family protein [Paludibacteraceae bacterium]|nr:TolC family protein [Paludibacteraceae bacterium]
MKRILFLTVILLSMTVQAQVTLDSCRRWAQANYPAIRQYALIQQSAEYSVQNAARAWIPHVVLSAQATYQSDAANMKEVWDAMGMNTMLAAMGKEIPDLYMRKFQGKVQLDIHQTIWDGGLSMADKRSAQAERQQQEAQADVDFYQLDNRVMSLYFGLLLLNEQQAQLTKTDSLLRSNFARVRTLYENNMVLQSDVDAVEVEVLFLEQKREQLLFSRAAYAEMLSLMTAHDLREVELQLPTEQESSLNTETERPELRLLNAQSQYITSQRKRVLSASMPHFSAFAQGWYGYPNLDMFKSMQSAEWGLNGIVGVRMQWNIGAYYTQKNRLNQLELSRQRIDVQRDVFLYNRQMQVVQENAEIVRLRKALEKDNRIVALRGNVRQAAEIKYENGTITTSELLQKITDESAALSAQALHRIELIKAQYELKNL